MRRSWSQIVNATTLGVSAFIQTILDDPDAATARTTLGLGTIATQNATAVAITGGTISDGVNPAASSLNEAVPNVTASANLDFTIAASTTEIYRIEVDAEDSGGVRSCQVAMARVVRSGSGTATTTGTTITFSEGSGLSVAVTVSGTNTVRTATTNTMGAPIRLDTRIWRVSSKATVEYS